MAKAKHCPRCGRTTVARSALLPGGAGVVCQSCFKETTGHQPLPPTRRPGMLSSHLGQSLYDSPGDDTYTGAHGPTVHRQTLHALARDRTPKGRKLGWTSYGQDGDRSGWFLWYRG